MKSVLEPTTSEIANVIGKCIPADEPTMYHCWKAAKAVEKLYAKKRGKNAA